MKRVFVILALWAVALVLVAWLWVDGDPTDSFDGVYWTETPAWAYPYPVPVTATDAEPDRAPTLPADYTPGMRPTVPPDYVEPTHESLWETPYP